MDRPLSFARAPSSGLTRRVVLGGLARLPAAFAGAALLSACARPEPAPPAPLWLAPAFFSDGTDFVE